MGSCHPSSKSRQMHFAQHHSVWKIIEKVSLKIASEASYVYIQFGQKFIKNAEIGQFGEFLKWDILGDF